MGTDRVQSQPKDSSEPANGERMAAQARTPESSASYHYPQGLSMAGAAAPDDIPMSRDNLLFLQRTIGNRGVARLMQRKEKSSRAADEVQPRSDWVERSMGARPTIQRECACGGTVDAPHKECAECRAKQSPVQRQAKAPTDKSSLPPSVTEVMRSNNGLPLPKSTRAKMENALGANLSGVRVHTGSQAARAAEDINARAFTTGQDIYFGAGQYQPDTDQGQRLLAHELTHTIQQTSGRSALQTDSLISQPGDPLEREAEAMADTVGRVSPSTASPERPAPSQPQSSTRPIIQRAWYDVFAEGAEWVGSQIASGAGAVWEGAKWVGGVAKDEAMRVGGAAWECAQVAGVAIGDLVTFRLPSLSKILGIPEPSEGSPIGTLDIILAIFRHACLRMIPGYPLLAGAVGKLPEVYSFLKGSWELLQNPEIIIEGIRESLGGMVIQVPEMARALARKAITFSDPPLKHLKRIWCHLEPKLKFLADNWWEVLKQTGWDLLWPWPGVGKDLGEIWGHIKAGASDLWNLNLSGATDHLLAVWRTANNLLGRLYGWFFIASVLVGAIIGAFFGGAGALPGAAAGAKFALAVGQGLLISMIAAETASITKAGYDLVFTEQKAEEQEEDYEQIANSSLVLAITGVLYVIGVIAARFARSVIDRLAAQVWKRPALRGRGKTSRGDVIEIRVRDSLKLIGILRRRRVTWLEIEMHDFPAIDLLDGGLLIRPSGPRGAPTIQLNGGRLISVKSTATRGRAAVNAIRGWIRDLARFTGSVRRNVTVVNPAGRTLIVAVKTPLDDAAVAAIRTFANSRGVVVEMFTNLPPNHPALVFPDAIPAILAEAGLVLVDEAGNLKELAPDETEQECK
jgi:Domain of unknown function (DUF4157)